MTVNNSVQVIVVDEIGSADEVRAVKSIAQRGVMLVGTAHGVSLSSLIGNPELNALVGGVHQVVVGDMQAKYVLVPVMLQQMQQTQSVLALYSWCVEHLG